MRILPLFFLVFLLACFRGKPVEDSTSDLLLAPADPTQYGLDAEEVELITKQVNASIDSGYISGAVALVAKNDRIIFHQAFGHSDRNKSKAMTTNNIFRLASMTKPITSTAIMQLFEQGKISLDDPVSKYIPEFVHMRVLESWDATDSSFTTVPTATPITIHHLLTHTSGLPYQIFHPVAGILYPRFGLTEAWTKDSIVLADNIPKFANAPLMHQPGEKWTYGTGIDVLGYVVEIVSGMPLDKYLEKNIFQPLNINDISFYLDDAKADRLVDVWLTSDYESDSSSIMSTDYPVHGAKSYFAGGAGLVGTSSDYLKFASALLNGGALGNSRILKPETVEMMFKNQIDSLRRPNGEGFGYGGAVVMEDKADGRNRGHWGWDGFWQTRFRIDRQNDLILILLTNSFPTPKFNEILGGYDQLVVQSIED